MTATLFVAYRARRIAGVWKLASQVMRFIGFASETNAARTRCP